jgi:diguanylate cyclase (GGDEF)-like protein/PAS domain S-box-containing protein
MATKSQPPSTEDIGNTESYYQRIFEDAPIGIYRTTPQGKIVDANPTLVRMLGYPDLETLKSVDVSTLYVEPRERVEEQYLLAKTGKVRAVEFQLHRYDGEIIWVRDTSTVIHDEERNILYYEGGLEDITERVEAEEKLRAYQVRVESERAQRQLAETLREVMNSINATLEQSEIFELVLTNLDKVVPYDSSTLMLIQDKNMQVLAAQGFSDPEEVQAIEFPIQEDELFQGIVETQKPLVITNLKEEPHYHGYTAAHYVRSWIGVPLISQDEVIGILTLDSRTANAYGEREAQVAFTFASQVVTAIRNASIYENERQRANELAALRETVTDISVKIELPELLRTMLERATTLLKSSSGELALYDQEEGDLVIAVCHQTTSDYTGQRIKIGEGAVGHVAQTREPLLIPDYQTWEGSLPDFASAQARGVMAVPMVVRGKLVGVIVLADYHTGRQYNESDISLLTLYAQQAAIAIDNAQLYDKAQHLATIDPLTGINNRMQLFELGWVEFARARRYGSDLSAMMMDIDYFKRINDTYGHATGDQVLEFLAGIFTQNLRDSDILGRYGGEEFVILLPETNIEAASSTAERLRIQIAETPFHSKDGKISITISIGVVDLQDDIPDLASLIDCADTAMYIAKNKGRNRICTIEI